MSQLENKLRLMGYTFPPPFQFPNPNRTGCVAAGSIVFVSGSRARSAVAAPGQARRKARP